MIFDIKKRFMCAEMYFIDNRVAYCYKFFFYVSVFDCPSVEYSIVNVRN